jgi:hypothetical protein
MKKLFNLFIVITAISSISAAFVVILQLIIFGGHYESSFVKIWSCCNFSAVMLIAAILIYQNRKMLYIYIKDFINS